VKRGAQRTLIAVLAVATIVEFPSLGFCKTWNTLSLPTARDLISVAALPRGGATIA
jgi:hypothetical protein